MGQIHLYLEEVNVNLFGCTRLGAAKVEWAPDSHQGPVCLDGQIGPSQAQQKQPGTQR